MGKWILDLPEKLSHGDASLVQHRCDQFCQVQPDVGDVYRDVFSHLQDLMEPDDKHTQRDT